MSAPDRSAPRCDRVLAVDIGGTKMAVAVVDGLGQVLWSMRWPTPTDGTDPFGELERLVAQVPPEWAPVACGVGIGGPMTGGGTLVSPLNIPAWRNFPLSDRLADRTGLPTWLDNDAKALALGEAWVGAGVGRQGFLSMVVSTGVGGGIVVDGRLLDGDDGNAGHIGHVIVEPDGRHCECGGYGCLEAEASGLSIAAMTGRPPAQADRAMRERTGRLVGRGVASVCNLLDVKLATVAGSVALGFGAPFFAAARTEMDQRCRLSFSRRAEIVPSALGVDGPLVGAAAVARRGLGRLPGGSGTEAQQ
ncbi:MAG: ROK family protein [Actinomycetota bacterium]|nr:ROK family protein [Actinomycetota bacterium]